MAISKRLKSIAGLVINTDKVADIGCDHALLDIYLVKEGICDNIIATDLNEEPVSNAKKNVKKHHLNDHIEVKQGNGIETINKDTDTLIISGMGTNTIIKILNNPKLNQINKMIIESNNDYYLLRSVICKKGFYISHESVIYDKGKYYINIVFLRGYKKYSLKELKYGPILMYSNNSYYEFLEKKQEQILDNIPKYKIIARLKIRKDLIYLKRLSK